MCEINPAHKKVFRIEAFTSDKNMKKEDFDSEVCFKLLNMEHELNKDFRFRFHVHEEEEDS